MSHLANYYDVVILGAGTAGLTAAIAAALEGLSVCVFERRSTRLNSPGETLHPGCGVIFDQLGILTAIESAATARHLGIQVIHGNDISYEPYGQDLGGSWRGYQLPRDRLSRTLLVRALELGAEVRMGNLVRNVYTDDENTVCLDTSDGSITCRWLLDGTGRSGWSARKDTTEYEQGSPRLTARYGYSIADKSSPSADWPLFNICPTGWFWQANLGNGQVAWVELQIADDTSGCFRSAYLGGHSADVTWRVATQPAKARIYRIGDAALRLDPAAGRGVLRAMMSAIMAVHMITNVDSRSINSHTAEQVYNEWIRQWFSADCNELVELYQNNIFSFYI